MAIYIDIQKFRYNYLEIQKYNTFQDNIFVSDNIDCVTSLTINPNVFKEVYGSALINSAIGTNIISISKKYVSDNINSITFANTTSLLKNIATVNSNISTSVIVSKIIKNIGVINLSNTSLIDINILLEGIGIVNTNCISSISIDSILKIYRTESVSTLSSININSLLKKVGEVNISSIIITHIEGLTKLCGNIITHSISSINIITKVNKIKEIYKADIVFDGAIKYIPTSYSGMNNKQYSNLYLLNYEQILKKDKRLIITDQNYPIKHILNAGQNFNIDFDFTMKLRPIKYIRLEKRTNYETQQLTYEQMTSINSVNILDMNYPIKVVI